MPESTNGLTLEGLARLLREQAAETTARFAEVAARFDTVGTQLDTLRGDVGAVAVMIRELSQVVARHHDQLAELQRQRDEDRQYIRQIFSRMEQHDARMAEHDARFEELTREIRRILDAIERRGGDGGHRAK